MALETGTYISDLVSTNPAGTDTLDKADDHLRLLKSTVKATFPNIAGAVTPTHTELNFVDGVTSAIQAQLDTKAPLASPTFTGVAAVQAGSAALPSLIPTGDTNTGFWFPAADTLAVSTAGGERMRIDASGNVGIGNTPGVKLDVTGVMRSAGWSLNGSGGITGGTTAFSAGTVSTDINWGMYFRVPTGSASNAEFSWRSAADAERFRVDTSGNVIVTGSGGLGYGTGSGGTVTQITSKSTAVTLNKTNGRVITTADALGAGANVVFAVNNTTIAATDTVVVGVASPTAKYNVNVVGTAAGSFDIRLGNFTGGSLSEAVTINFSVIKAVTS